MSCRDHAEALIDATLTALGESDTRGRILRALARGPLDEGTLELIVNEPDFRGKLTGLQRAGKIRRTTNNPYRWELRA